MSVPPQFQSTEDRSPAAPSFRAIQDIDAEMCVLGGMMHSVDAIGDVLPLVRPDQFAAPAHETIYRAILAVYGDGQPAEPGILSNRLTKTGELAKVGGLAYLHELANHAPSGASAPYYADIVREKAVLRKLRTAALGIAAMTEAQEGEVAEIANQAQADVYAACEVSKEEDGDVALSDVMRSALGEIENIEKHKGEITGVASGLKDFDALTNGLQPGQMIVIAARPAMGKSTLAIDFARNCSIKHNLPSMVFSLEMGKNEIGMRILSAESRTALHHMRSGTMTEKDWDRVARRMPVVEQAPLYIDDSADITLNYIRAKARRRKAQSGLSLIVVDYLQLMQSETRRKENRQQEVSDISRGLKLLAKELEVPVVALSQLNRGPEHRTDKKPLISDLRESGAIEQDADMVILLHREDQYEKESPRAGEADLIVAKHRNGPTATITVAFQGHYSRFVDMAQT